MLYLIFAQQITVGQFFSLFIYSFFIFGPLQELGNVINTYRETEASLANFEAHPANAQGAASAPAGDDRSAAPARVRSRRLSAPDGLVARADRHLLHGRRAVRRWRSSGPRDRARRRWSSCWSGCTRRRPDGSSTTVCRAPTIELDRLRERIGFVTQDTQLFSGTIRENLLFVNPDATDAECLEVLHQAACDSLLARAQKGLDTVIGEGGVKVSGGEKQRLSIARALLRRPQLLIFDEATSSLDSLTEEGITDTIRAVTANRDVITVMIAHRLSTVLQRRSDLRAGAGPDRRIGPPPRTARAEGAVLRDVAAADRRAPRRSGPDWCARDCDDEMRQNT